MTEQPRVQLVAYTPDAEKLIASAAKLCYASSTDAILDGDADESRRFIERLRSMGHMSPFEHASYTFLVEGVSRALTHQLVRHRIASYSQRSQRYVAHDEFEYIIPPSFEGRTVATEDGEVDAVAYLREFMTHTAEVYRRLRDSLGSGESANQDARYVLPNAAETKIFVTMNARELFHFFGERLCTRAQWEIRRAADRMITLAREVSPGVFGGVGPKCVQLGRCPEGKKSCGQMADMRKKYLHVNTARKG